MKINRIKTSAAPFLLLAGSLLLPQSAFSFYNPSTGRWLTRDPVDEAGGVNLYAFAGNDAVQHADALGLEWRWVDAEAEGKDSFDWRIKRWIGSDDRGHGSLHAKAVAMHHQAYASGDASIYGQQGRFFPTTFEASDHDSVGFGCDSGTGYITIYRGTHISRNPPEASADVAITDITFPDPHTVIGVVQSKVGLKISPGSAWTVSVLGVSAGPSVSVGSEDATLTIGFMFQCRCR